MVDSDFFVQYDLLLYLSHPTFCRTNNYNQYNQLQPITTNYNKYLQQMCYVEAHWQCTIIFRVFFH